MLRVDKRRVSVGWGFEIVDTLCRMDSIVGEKFRGRWEEKWGGDINLVILQSYYLLMIHVMRGYELNRQGARLIHDSK